MIGWVDPNTREALDTFPARENPAAYILEVDYVKGSGASNLRFSIMVTPLTAGTHTDTNKAL